MTFKEICKDLSLSMNSLLLGKSGLIFNGNAVIYKFTQSAIQPDTSHPFANSLKAIWSSVPVTFFSLGFVLPLFDFWEEQ